MIIAILIGLCALTVFGMGVAGERILGERRLRALPAPEIRPLVSAVVHAISSTPALFSYDVGSIDGRTGAWSSHPTLRATALGVIVVYTGTYPVPTDISRPSRLKLTDEEAEQIQRAWDLAQANRINSAVGEALEPGAGVWQ